MTDINNDSTEESCNDNEKEKKSSKKHDKKSKKDKKDKKKSKDKDRKRSFSHSTELSQEEIDEIALFKAAVQGRKQSQSNANEGFNNI